MLVDASFVPAFARKARLVRDRHTGRAMILYPERGLDLNDAAAAIAEKIDGARSIAAITDALTVAHEGAPRATVECDVITFVTELRDRGLLERR
jgi:coenzyme PQQ biosynthesis protein PqqD